jgi:hypothetical protein
MREEGGDPAPCITSMYEKLLIFVHSRSIRKVIVDQDRIQPFLARVFCTGCKLALGATSLGAQRGVKSPCPSLTPWPLGFGQSNGKHRPWWKSPH